jgi:hypothetical protein
MNLSVTVGMKQDQIVQSVVSAQATPKKVVDVPTLGQRQRLTADQTFAVLLQPKVTCRPPARQGAGHLSCQALLKIQLPGRIVRIRRPLDLHMSPNGYVTGADENYRRVE